LEYGILSMVYKYTEYDILSKAYTKYDIQLWHTEYEQGFTDLTIL